MTAGTQEAPDAGSPYSGTCYTRDLPICKIYTLALHSCQLNPLSDYTTDKSKPILVI